MGKFSRMDETWIVLLAGFLILSGCAGHGLPVSHSPETLGEIGAELNRNPDRKDAILSSHDITMEEFREALRRIAEDPELSERYEEGFNSKQSKS